MVNTTDESLVIFAENSRKLDEKNDVFNSKYEKLAEITPSQYKKFSHRHDYKYEVTIGAEYRSGQHDARRSNEYDVAGLADYHLVVWEQDNKIKHELIAESFSFQGYPFTIRVFSPLEDVDIFVDDIQMYSLDKGKVSMSLNVGNCEDSLVVEEQPISLCDYDLDHAYLVVITDEKVLVIPE